VTERQWQKLVIDYAHLHGFRVAHFRPAPTGREGRWVTPVALDGKGFPDLVMVRESPPAVVFAELKAAKGRVSADQQAWLDALRAAGAQVFVWRPDAWAEVQRVLGRA